MLNTNKIENEVNIMPRKSAWAEFGESIREGKKKHTLTFSGWLRYEKKLSSEQIEALWDDREEDTKLQQEHRVWLDAFSEHDLDILRAIFKIAYPCLLRLRVCHFKRVKRQMMKALEVNRWEFDKILFALMKKSHDSESGTHAFYLMACGGRCGGRLNYVSQAKRGESGTFQNSFCYIGFDDRNKYTKQLIEEWRSGK